MSVWRGGLARLLWLVFVTGGMAADQSSQPTAASPSANAGSTTDAERVKAVKLRDELLKGRGQDGLLKSWGSSPDSLQGVLIPPSVQRPNLTAAQMLKLRDMVDQQRNWMFVNPSESTQTSPLDEVNQTSPTGEGAFDNGGSSILKRFLDRPAAGRLSPTNGFSRGGRDNLDSPDDDPLLGKRTKDDLVAPETRSVFDRAETAASKAISRLFAPDGGRQLAVEAAPGKFSDIFSPPASIPMERSVAEQQHMTSFQDVLNSSARSSASPYSPGAIAVPSASGSPFGGGDGLSSVGGSSGFSSSSSGSELLGASSLPSIAPPASSSAKNFLPVTVPRRKF